MSGLGIRLYTDEDVHARLAEQLRRLGYDALSCRDAERHLQGISDEEQLAYAAQEGRAILINNIVDYARCEHEWKAQGRRHYGIIVVEQGRPIGELVSRVQRHLDTVDPATQYDTWLFLGR